MDGTVILRAGTPNDENRDYLPEAIKGSDMVVNENGNNSQPYPERLQEHTGVLTDDGLMDRWYEYVPASYDGSRKVPPGRGDPRRPYDRVGTCHLHLLDDACRSGGIYLRIP